MLHGCIRTSLLAGAVLALALAGRASAQCAPADVDGNGLVEVADLLAVLASWDDTGGPADVNGDGIVDTSDLLEVLACWGEQFPPDDGPLLATNLASCKDWMPPTFSDIFKQSRRQWFSSIAGEPGPFDTGYADLMYGDDGWPNVEIPFDPDGAGPIPPQAMHTIMVRDLYWGSGGPFPPSDSTWAERYPAGNYIVSFEGDGAIEMWGSDFVKTTFDGPGSHIFTVDDPDNGGLGIKIIASSGTDPVRNIQVRMPGYSTDDGQNPYGPFTTDYVEALQDFDVVRFMNWAETNDRPCTNGIDDPRDPLCEQSWDGRTLVTHRTQTADQGVAIEYMIDLCNAAGVDPWFVIPHAVTDEHVEEMALLVAQRLDPERTIYLEYSNELWNWGFDQFHYAFTHGEPIAQHAVFAWQARRSGEIFCLFKEAGGFSDDRLVTMLCTQFNNVWTGEKALQYWLDPVVNPNTCNVELDCIGVGAYFADDDEHEADENDTIDQVVEKVLLSIHEGRYHMRSLEYAALAQQFGVRLIAYEGGQHLVWSDNDSPLQDTFAELNRDPRIKQLYHEAWQEWVANTGGDLYTYMSFAARLDKQGSFGHREYSSQPLYSSDADGLRAYKMEAVMEIKAGDPPPP